MPAEIAELAKLTARAHPTNGFAQRLMQLISPSAATSDMAVSPEHAVLARVADLKARSDFASLVRDMDAFPELEELQRAAWRYVTS